MNFWKELDAYGKVPEVINVIIEVKAGSRNKYVYDTSNAFFVLEKVLAPSLRYPADVGIVPKTRGDDNEPLRVIVLAGESTFPGCVVQARPVGILRVNRDGHRSDKLLAVAISDPDYASLGEISGVPKSLLENISTFFVELGGLENATVDVIGWGGVDDAYKLVNHAVRLCREQQSLVKVNEEEE